MTNKQGKSERQSGSVAVNRKARRDYEIVSTIEVGIVLAGSEVKSARAGGINLVDSYVKNNNGEMFLVNCHFAPYSHSAVDAHELTRDRKLLLHKREIERLTQQIRQKGLAIIPLQVYLKDGRIKVELGVGRGRKLHDKRDVERDREADRNLRRVMKAKLS